MQRWVILIGAVFWILALSAPVSAQTAAAPVGQVFVTAVDVSRFPEVQAYLAVQNEQGRHLAGLPASAFQLTENQAAPAGLAILEAEVGVQIVFVLDVGAAFKTRDANGINRLDYLKQALTDFVRTGLKETDDVTIVTSDGPLIAHVSAGAPVADALARYTPTFDGAADPYALLNTGLNYAADVPPRPGMRRLLVIAANGLPTAPASALPDAQLRAQAAGIQVHTLFVGPDGAQDTAGAQMLRRLSEASNGLTLHLQAPGSLAPVFQALAEQRPQYRLSYRSAISRTGQHTLSVRVQTGAGEVAVTPPAAFQLRVEAPTISFVDPPARLALADAGQAYPLDFQVAYPDGHPRLLQTVQLVVDGQPLPAAAPGEAARLAWPVGDYTESLTHTLQLRVTDELGLLAESRPIEVFVEALARPAPEAATAAAVWPQEALYLAGGVGLALVLAGLSLAVVYGRRRLRAQTAAAPAGPAAASLARAKTAAFEPKQTMPMPAAVAPARRVRLPSLQFVDRKVRHKPRGPAYLEVVEPGTGRTAHDVIDLAGGELRIGRDPRLAEAVFPDLSVSRLHARLAEAASGKFLVFDEGSTSGTWVNFTQVKSEAGVVLKSGDLINLGRVQLRFQIRAPQAD